jgi:hypothetical protein
MFVKNPGFTAIAVISIASAVAATAIFSGRRAAAAAAAGPAAGRAHHRRLEIKVGIGTRNAASYPDYVDIRERGRRFGGLLAYTSRTIGFSAHPGTAPQAKVATLVSGNFFPVLDVEPVVGRGFLPEEDSVPGRDAVTVLSYGVWQQDFAGDPAVLGRKVTIAGIDFTVIGVAPEWFTGIDARLFRDAVYLPIAMWARVMNADKIDPLTPAVFANVALADARCHHGRGAAELTVIGRPERAYPTPTRT